MKEMDIGGGALTVEELIEKLTKLPQDMDVYSNLDIGYSPVVDAYIDTNSDGFQKVIVFALSE